MWKKILFFGLTGILGIIVAIMTNYSGYLQNIANTARSAAEAKEYDGVVRVFNTYFDFNSVISSDITADKCFANVYPAVCRKNIKKEKKEYIGLQKCYAVYLFDIEYDKINFQDVKEEGDKLSNKSGIVLINDLNDEDPENDLSYPYYFKMNPSLIQYEEYKKIAKAKAEANQEDEKEIETYNQVSQLENFSFLMIYLSEEIFSEIDGIATDIVLQDSEGNVIFKKDFNMSFAEPFFTDVEELISTFNSYVVDEISKKEFEEKIIRKKEEFAAKNNDYRIGYLDSKFRPASLIWQTVGVCAIYMVCIFAFFVLIFKRNWFKGLRGRGSRNSGQKPINKDDLSRHLNASRETLDVKKEDIKPVDKE